MEGDHARFLVDASAIFLFGSVWFGACVFLWVKKEKRFVYLLFFTLFCIYLYKVLDHTLFQFQSLLLLRYFIPDLMLRGLPAEESVNLVPLVTLTFEDLRTSLLNILLLMPFGFGLPFVTGLRMKQAVIAGAIFSICIELLQFLSGFAADVTFRIADINDVIFNTAGAALGYMLFIAFVRVCRRAFSKGWVQENPILQHITQRPQADAHR